MRKKPKNNCGVKSLKFKVQSLRPSFDFRLSTFNLVNALLVILLLSACTGNSTSHEHTDTYTCPMHPTVVSDKPGVCPVCGMDLVKKGRHGEEVKITEDIAKLIKSPNEVVLASVKTMKPEYKSRHVSITVQGVVTYDTRNIYTIPARVGGRLEKVLLKYNYQPVHKGQKVADIYSPELVNAQREYLYLIKNDPTNQPLLDGAKSKLSLLGASVKQIDELSEKQEVSYTFSIYSPYGGFVISENQSAPSVPGNKTGETKGTSGGMGMGGGNSAVTSSTINSPVTSSFAREGSYVATGQTLFRIVSTHSLWIEFNVPLTQASQIKVGDKLDWAGKPLKIDFVEPFFAEGEDFIKLRSYYHGSDVSIGQLVEASIKITSAQALWIPKDALLDLGLDQIVFVKERGMLKPRKVEAGLSSGDWIEIKSGLASSDEVAVNAQYLVDSENFIKTSN